MAVAISTALAASRRASPLTAPMSQITNSDRPIRSAAVSKVTVSSPGPEQSGVSSEPSQRLAVRDALGDLENIYVPLPGLVGADGRVCGTGLEFEGGQSVRIVPGEGERPIPEGDSLVDGEPGLGSSPSLEQSGYGPGPDLPASLGVVGPPEVGIFWVRRAFVVVGDEIYELPPAVGGLVLDPMGQLRVGPGPAGPGDG